MLLVISRMYLLVSVRLLKSIIDTRCCVGSAEESRGSPKMERVDNPELSPLGGCATVGQIDLAGPFDTPK